MADTGDSVKQEDFTAFLKGYAPDSKRAGEKDTLAGRYHVVTNQPLNELSSSYAKAFAARDENNPNSSLYALVYETGVPLRKKNITALKNFRHPALVSLLAEGLIETGAGSETRYACVLEKPAGQTLAQILARRTEPLPESLLISQYLRPLNEILLAFLKLGISHNRIHPGNIYVSDTGVVLGECIGEPSGFSQDYLFEPVERMLTSPRAKADFSPTADCYALGILALHLSLGFAPFTQVHKDVMIRNILVNGAYHTLVMPWDLPATLQDFLRGVFNDGRRDRWDALTIESWLSGRRYNLILPNQPRETSRGFEFNEAIYYNRKMLAHSIWQNWKESRALLTDNRLARWLTIHAHKPETADAISRLAPAGTTLSTQQENEALTRIITLLDPAGPLRFRQIATAVEAVGALLAHSIIAERPDDVRALQQIIESDLINHWIEQQKTNPDYVTLAGKLHKARNHMRMKGLGFGLERMLYDLNPSLPCLSPLLKSHQAMTPSELLQALDAIAPQKVQEDLTDTHIAAFLASHLDVSREIKLSDLHSLPALATHPGLIMLRLLAQAHGKSDSLVLKGLCHWLAARLLPLLDGIHSRARQKKLKADLRAAATKGSVKAMADMFLSPQGFEADIRDFKKATNSYAALKDNITALKTGRGLAHEANVKGRGVAQSIAYSVCITTIYMTLKSYFHI